MDYFLLDSRAGILAAQNDGILPLEDRGKYVLSVGTLKECCKKANKGDFGDHCVVADKNYTILWECYNKHGHWVFKNIKNGK